MFQLNLFNFLLFFFVFMVMIALRQLFEDIVLWIARKVEKKDKE